jgi:hypothetical protein
VNKSIIEHLFYDYQHGLSGRAVNGNVAVRGFQRKTNERRMRDSRNAAGSRAVFEEAPRRRQGLPSAMSPGGSSPGNVGLQATVGTPPILRPAPGEKESHTVPKTVLKIDSNGRDR